MKNTLRPLLVVLAAAVCSAAAAAQSAQEIEAFEKEFERARALGDSSAMAELVKEHDEAAVHLAVEICEAIGRQSSEELEKRIAALRTAWKEAHGGRFVDRQYEYLALMSSVVRQHREELGAALAKSREALDRALEKDDFHAFAGIAVDLVDLAEAYEGVGDSYNAARCWRLAARCYEEETLGPEADLKKVWEHLGSFLEARETIDLRTSDYVRLKSRHEALDLSGYGDEPAAGDADRPGGAAGGEGASGERAAPTRPSVLSAPMTFELVEDVEEYERPGYNLDVLFPLWNVCGLAGEGSVGTIFTREKGPSVIRTGMAEAAVDTDGDGAPDVDIPLTGNIEPVAIPVGGGDEARPWGLSFAIANSRRNFQQVEMNLAPQQNSLWLYFGPAASVVGELEGTDLRVFDDNMDGVYGSYPRAWELLGLGQGQFQPQMDSILVGGGDKAVPWSQFLQIGDEWYQMEVESDGLVLTAKPTPEVRTGYLRLKAKGEDPDFLVVQGSGKWQNCYFDLTEGGSKGLEVPAGQYKLFCGVIRDGKREQMRKALILAGESKSVTVKPDETATLEIGEPYRFAFDYDTSGETVTIRGSSIQVVGQAGEVYDRIWNAVVEPEVSLRERGARRGTRGEDMRLVQHQNDLALVGGFGGAFRPIDLELSTERVGSEFEVMLVEKRNKLFGTIESEWK